MDIFIPIVICVIFFILFSVCGWCCTRKRQGTVYGPAGTNVTITTQPISASPVVVPPYPVEPRHPTPHGQVGTPGLGFATHGPPYPTYNPHPTAAHVYYGPPIGAAPYPTGSHAPYPPPGPIGSTAPYPDYAAQPPSYAEAVSHPPVQPLPVKEVYGKQAPYNPNY